MQHIFMKARRRAKHSANFLNMQICSLIYKHFKLSKKQKKICIKQKGALKFAAQWRIAAMKPQLASQSKIFYGKFKKCKRGK